MENNERMVNKIKEGIVIDHLPSGSAFKILSLINNIGKHKGRIAVLSNTKSSKLGMKDIIKIEGKSLDYGEMSSISLIAPNATICKISEYGVSEKHTVSIPDKISGILNCSNMNCISNNDVEAIGDFSTISKDPLILICNYCNTAMLKEDILQKLNQKPFSAQNSNK
jgi:aspartate carbamoyltransferase regulatory subunit